MKYSLCMVFSLASVLPATAAKKLEFTFAGVPVTAGATVRANVPLDATEKSYAAEAGNPVPANALPRTDTSGWRAGMTLAALDALHRGFPGSNKWPVACAGYSGGAKRAGLLTPLLALSGCRIIGLFLTGINVDRLSDGYRQFKPGSGFLRTPIFVSSGANDNVATSPQQWQVKLSMERTGFSRVRLETFPQGHNVKLAHVREALRWFRQLQTAN